MDSVMGLTRKDLLEFEQPRSSSIESTLLVCSNGSSLSQKKNLSTLGSAKLSITSVPTSQVLDRVKDFLGVMAEANKKLELEALENARENYDVEVLTGNEKEYIEMDLMLGLAELHSQEAVNAAEHALAGTQPSLFSHDNDDSDGEENSEDSDEADEADPCNETNKRSTNAKSDNARLKKQQKNCRTYLKSASCCI